MPRHSDFAKPLGLIIDQTPCLMPPGLACRWQSGDNNSLGLSQLDLADEVRPGIYCLPRHLTHLELSFLKLYGIL